MSEVRKLAIIEKTINLQDSYEIIVLWELFSQNLFAKCPVVLELVADICRDDTRWDAVKDLLQKVKELDKKSLGKLLAFANSLQPKKLKEKKLKTPPPVKGLNGSGFDDEIPF